VSADQLFVWCGRGLSSTDSSRLTRLARRLPGYFGSELKAAYGDAWARELSRITAVSAQSALDADLRALEAQESGIEREIWLLRELRNVGETLRRDPPPVFPVAVRVL
jgi:hypothetical protein